MNKLTNILFSLLITAMGAIPLCDILCNITTGNISTISLVLILITLLTVTMLGGLLFVVSWMSIED